MRAILDTHTLLWFWTADPRLSTRARRLIESADRELFVSAISAAEISVKYVIGKLKLPATPREFLAKVTGDLMLMVLPVTLDHGVQVADLPLHHADPFDRLLIAQAQIEKMPIITDDWKFSRYSVSVYW